MRSILIFIFTFLMLAAARSQCPGCKFGIGNIVTNGNFENGNTGFITDYLWNTDLYNEGTYFIDRNPQIHHPDFRGRDHTTGAGNFMMVNGETAPGMSVWCQTVTVTPNTDYSFSTWVCSLHPSNPALLQFSINGVSIGAVFAAPNAINVWQEFFVTWNSGASTTATICIENQTTQPAGNDFGLDDISFTPCLPFAVALSKTIHCKNQDDTIRTTLTGGRAPFTYTWSNGATGSFITNLSPGTYSVTVTDATGCKATQSISITAPQVPSVSLTVRDENCPGAADGAITSSVTGGTPPYSYLWSTGATSTGLSGLSPGNYSLTATDSKGCKGTASKVVATKSQPSVTITGDTVFCEGDSTLLTAGGSPGMCRWNNSVVMNSIVFRAVSDTICFVELTDANGCKTRDTVQIIVDPLPVVDISSDDVLCKGTKTGKAMASVQNGQPPYTILWNSVPSQSTLNANNLGAGWFTCSVTDKNGCRGLDSTEIKEPAAIEYTTSAVNASCGSMDGKATVSAYGGTGTLKYRWDTSPEQNTPTATGLGVGSYRCTISDANQCKAEATVGISNNSGPSASLKSKKDILCNGDQTGSATIQASNTTGQAAYLWDTSPVQTAATAVNLAAGTYTCRVSDNSSCVSSVVVTITEPAPLSLSLTSTPALCGRNDGSAQVTVTGGSPGYNYRWSADTTVNNRTLSGLNGNSTETVLVSDRNGCTASGSILVPGFGAPVLVPGEVQPVSCPEVKDGKIAVSISGGTAPFAVLWNTAPVQQDTIATGLASGWHSVTVTDKNNCRDSLAAFVPPADSLRASFVIADDTCGRGHGAITVQASGGKGPLTYNWDTPVPQNTASLTGLIPGTYTLTLTDSIGCNAVYTATVGEIPGPAIARVDIVQPVCAGDFGTATVIATGTGLSFRWNTNPPQSTAAATGLTTGLYTCRVTDQYLCEVTATASINAPAPVPVFSLGPDTAICAGDSIRISPDRAGTAYQWNTGAILPFIHASSGGLYYLTLTESGCSFRDSINIRLDQVPPLGLPQDSVFCGAFNLTTDITVSGNALYRWDNGSISPVRTFSGPGLYWAEITRGRCLIRDTVIFGADPPITVTLPRDSTLCSGSTLLLSFQTDAVSPVISWTGGVSTGTFLVDTAGYYFVTLVQGVCRASDTIRVDYIETPDVELGRDTVLCDGEILQLSAGSKPFNYSWNTGETGAAILVRGSGLYRARAVNNLCSDEDSILVTFKPVPVFALGPDSSICAGGKISIGITDQPGTAYLWNTGETNPRISVSGGQLYELTATRGGCSYHDQQYVSVIPLPVIHGKDTTICPLDTITVSAFSPGASLRWENGDTAGYQVVTQPSIRTVTATNLQGCESARIIRILPEPDCELGLYIPNAFSPDGDGINDYFFLEGEYILRVELDIFDRWGELIFSGSGIRPYWNGTYSGAEAKPDIYVWKARISTLDGKKKLLIGHVALLR